MRQCLLVAFGVCLGLLIMLSPGGAGVAAAAETPSPEIKRSGPAAGPTEKVTVVYLGKAYEEPPPLSLLEKILTERPNIVVLDVMMPGLSGWEISRYVRERQELDPVRIIMATGIGKDTNAATSPRYSSRTRSADSTAMSAASAPVTAAYR